MIELKHVASQITCGCDFCVEETANAVQIRADERHQRDNEARHAADHVAQIEPQQFHRCPRNRDRPRSTKAATEKQERNQEMSLVIASPHSNSATTCRPPLAWQQDEQSGESPFLSDHRTVSTVFLRNIGTAESRRR